MIKESGIVERWSCPQCNYSAPPHRNRSERKHFTAHWLTCDRCRYSTETQPSWEAAIAVYRKPAATLIAELQAGMCDGCGSVRTDGQCRKEQKSCCQDRKMLDTAAWRTRALAAESSLHRVRGETIEECLRIVREQKRISTQAAYYRAETIELAISSLNITGLDTGAVKTAESEHSPSTLNAETE